MKLTHRPKVNLRLDPGISSAVHCHVWIMHCCGDPVLLQEDLPTRTDDPGRGLTATAEADSVLARCGWERTGEWRPGRNNHNLLEAPCKRKRQ